MQDRLLKHQPDRSRARRFHSNLKCIAGLERFAVIQLGPDHHDDDALTVHLGEAQTMTQQILMSRMLEIMLVDRVIHDALHITFVISYFQAQAKRHGDISTHSSLIRIYVG